MWVEALRSTNYTQITGQLRNNCGYCTEGVMCDVLAKKWSGWLERDFVYDESSEDVQLPTALQKLLNWKQRRITRWVLPPMCGNFL